MTCSCQTGYSNTVAWTSEKFIGPHGERLEFTSFEQVPTRKNASGSSTTYAELIGRSNRTGVMIMNSILYIYVPSNISRSHDYTMTCLNVGHTGSHSKDILVTG